MTDRIWLYGASSAGSALAALLYGKIPVTLVGQSPHAARVKSSGLGVNLAGEEGSRTLPIPVCRPEELPALGEGDIVLLTGKIRSLPAAAAILRERLTPSAVVVALQNGMDFEAELARAMGHSLERGIIQFGSGSDGLGSVWYFRGRLILPSGRVADLLTPRLSGSPVECQVEEDFGPVIWHKLLINSVANALAGILRINNTQLAGEILNPVKASILSEVRAVAARTGIELTATLADLNRYLNTANVPSLVRDLERGLPTEIDWINGAVVRRGVEYQIPTPVNAALVAMVKCLEEQGEIKEG